MHRSMFSVNEDCAEGFSLVRYVGNVAIWVERTEDGLFSPKVTTGDWCDLVGEGEPSKSVEHACEDACRIARIYFEACARGTLPFAANGAERVSITLGVVK